MENNGGLAVKDQQQKAGKLVFIKGENKTSKRSVSKDVSKATFGAVVLAIAGVGGKKISDASRDKENLQTSWKNQESESDLPTNSLKQDGDSFDKFESHEENGDSVFLNWCKENPGFLVVLVLSSVFIIFLVIFIIYRCCSHSSRSSYSSHGVSIDNNLSQEFMNRLGVSEGSIKNAEDKFQILIKLENTNALLEKLMEDCTKVEAQNWDVREKYCVDYLSANGKSFFCAYWDVIKPLYEQVKHCNDPSTMESFSRLMNYMGGLVKGSALRKVFYLLLKGIEIQVDNWFVFDLLFENDKRFVESFLECVDPSRKNEYIPAIEGFLTLLDVGKTTGRGLSALLTLFNKCNKEGRANICRIGNMSRNDDCHIAVNFVKLLEYAGNYRCTCRYDKHDGDEEIYYDNDGDSFPLFNVIAQKIGSESFLKEELFTKLEKMEFNVEAFVKSLFNYSVDLNFGFSFGNYKYSYIKPECLP